MTYAQRAGDRGLAKRSRGGARLMSLAAVDLLILASGATDRALITGAGAMTVTPTATHDTAASGLADPGSRLLDSPSVQRQELALLAGVKTLPRSSLQPFGVGAAAVAGGTRQDQLAADLLRHARVTAEGLAPAPAALDALAFALAQISKPYQWGATGPAAYDCSGLTQQSYAHAGLAIPRTAAEQARVGTPVRLADLLPGDLLFYAYDVRNAASIHHVTMYAGNGLVVHAPQTGEYVHLSPMWLDEYIGAVRLVPAVAGTGGPGGTPASIPVLTPTHTTQPAAPPSAAAARTPASSAGPAGAPAAPSPTTSAASRGSAATTPTVSSLPADVTRRYRQVLAEVLPLVQQKKTGLDPALAALLRGDNPTAARSLTPLEIEQLTQQVGRLLRETHGAAPEAEVVLGLRQLLGAMHSGLTLHVVAAEGTFLLFGNPVAVPSR